ncbi:MAG: hypothetical protein EBU90_07730 [Proteobacteria bacterium]|nr:hypothetical protein [Pseudomonadota bacterium]NBP14088.1 hypothetical protein [bacterium]
MRMIWHKIESLANELEKKFTASGTTMAGNVDTEFDWHNELWSSIRYRRAHIEIVDKRDSHGIYILHSTVFPHFNDPSPIWGFDAICGRNKITGAFHDFSAAGDADHYMIKWFYQRVSNLTWSKERNLPEWAKQIFSPGMVAAGNIQEQHEVDLLCDLAIETLDYYLNNVGLSQDSGADFHMAQNRYCHYQKQNPQVVKSMISMGVAESTITKFVEKVLFPETV